MEWDPTHGRCPGIGAEGAKLTSCVGTLWDITHAELWGQPGMQGSEPVSFLETPPCQVKGLGKLRHGPGYGN